MRACFNHLADIERKRIPATPEVDMRLHRLERPCGWPESLVDAMKAAVTDVSRYPDYASFYERLAAFSGVPVDRLVVGLGIEGLIRDLVMLHCDPGDGFAFTWPTCAMFDVYARVFGAKAVKIETSPDRPLTTRNVVNALEPGVRLVVLPNPGQPVDNFFANHELRLIADHCKQIGAVLAVDEAYHGFGALETAIPLTDEFDNIVVLRTFSKAFGAAGLRIGYAVGQRSVIQPLDAVRMSGEVAGPSMAMAHVLMDRYESDVLPGIANIVKGRDWLVYACKQDGFKARGQYANHVLIDMGSAPAARTVAERLAKEGVHVRVNAAPCDKHLMVTAGPKEMMRKFYAAFWRAQGAKAA